jgi:pyruvate formate lyase activating enzyme
MNRRQLLKRCVIGGSGLALGVYTIKDFVIDEGDMGLRVGFYNDAPKELWKWSKEAMWYRPYQQMFQCQLCPHKCILAENDRGFCRTRIVKDKKMYSVAYGNPCAVHLDPIEKKPLYHFLPSSQIISVATAGCNLRCLNCQNWSISQYRPSETRNLDLMPETLVEATKRKSVPSIAYTYSEPIIFYEYVYDTSVLAREKGIRNVLVTAGYINEKPLRQLCRVTDAANVDLKGFNDHFYKKITRGRLDPVLKALEIFKEEGVWIELTRLIVPTHSDDLKDLRKMCKWVSRNLGPGTPVHFSRFHPAYKLRSLPPTPVKTLVRAMEIAREEGLHFAYVGNVPGHNAEDTVCPKCGRTIIERTGYRINFNKMENGACPCGEPIPGVWK